MGDHFSGVWILIHGARGLRFRVFAVLPQAVVVSCGTGFEIYLARALVVERGLGVFCKMSLKGTYLKKMNHDRHEPRHHRALESGSEQRHNAVGFSVKH